MCGIAGYKMAPGGEPRPEALNDMLGRIVHRGPDHRGVFLENGVGLGNQRLKIIDLEGGNQPIFNEDESVVVVYNGEIYNHPDLRRELEKKGHTFRTQADTEVLVHLYEEHGADFVGRLNGIFAFALYDRRRRKLLLARDRFGIKPLFYLDGRTGFYFGSEINALKASPDFSGELDYEALSIYLKFCYIPQPWSAYRQIRRLEAGHLMIVDEAGHREERVYYDVDFRKKARVSRQEAKREIRRLLGQAVERQLMSDVPVGIFLSGGVDSCAILSFAQPKKPDIETFTLSFADKEYDENLRAAPWAEFFGTRHHAVAMTPEDLSREMDARIEQFGEPLGPSINAGQTFIARKAYEAGFKVMLNGAGGDELFCGYPTLNAAWFASYYRVLPQRVRTKWIPRLVNGLPAGGNLPLSFKLKAFVNAVDDTPYHTFFNFKAVLPPGTYGELLTADAQRRMDGADPDRMFLRYREKVADFDLIDALQYLEMKTFLEGSILTGGDSAAMSASVEERVPFLDNDLVDFAASLPREVKFHRLQPKGLLRGALKDELTAAGGSKLLKRQEKRGYWLPANAWLRGGEMLRYAESRLSRERVEKHGFFRHSTVQRLLDEHKSGRHNHERRLQTVLGLMHFLEAGGHTP